MHRALSAEHLAELARDTINGLRRFIPGREVDEDSLATVTKAVDERCLRGNKPPLQLVALMIEHFCDEARLLISATAPVQRDASSGAAAVGAKAAADLVAATNAGPSAAGPVPPLTLSPSAANAVVRARKVSEQAVLHFFDCLRVTYRLLGPAVISSLVDTHAAHLLIELVDNSTISKKLHDGASSLLCDLLVESPQLFLDVAASMHERLSRVASTLEHLGDDSARGGDSRGSALLDAATVITTTRLMSLLIATFRRADLVSTADSNEIKAKFSGLGALQCMLHTASLIRGHLSGVPEEAEPHRAELLMCGNAALGVVFALLRSNAPNKEAVLASPSFPVVWAYYASQLGKLECSFSIRVQPTPGGGAASAAGAKGADVPVVLDSAAVWAAELVECVVELATQDSFSLRRQSMYSDMGLVGQASAGLPALDALQPGMTSAVPDPFANVRKWEVLPLNWDTIVASGAVFVWRLASASNPCVLSGTSSSIVLRCLALLDISSPLADFAYRAVVASLLLLCRANPQNISVLCAAGAFDVLLAVLTAPESVLRGAAGDLHRSGHSLVPSVALSLNHAAWPITVALLSTIVSSHCAPEQLRVLMRGCERMVDATITPEDCEILEHCFHVLSASVYARAALWFDGRSSAVVCPVDRFCGRWYGYSFLTWVNLPCVWSEGCLLFSYSEPSTPSKTIVSVVANGRSRCLSVRSTTNKELTITLLPEATIAEGWNHVVVVHNISGFTVYVNGRKCCTSSSVPYPKEPAKGQRLQFCFGGGDPGVSPLLGMMTTAQLIDKDMTDKDVERLFLAGPGSETTSIDPPMTVGELIRVSCDEAVAVTGTLIKDEVGAAEVQYQTIPDVPQLMDDAALVTWAAELISIAQDNVENRATVAVLCIELLTAYVKQCRHGLDRLQDAQFIEHLGSVLLRWDNTPPVLPGVLLSLVTKKSNAKLLRSHPVTTAVLYLLVDVVHGKCPTVTRCATMKELSDMLALSANAKIFREAPRLTSILDIARHIEAECVDDVVSVVEKLVKEQAELECAFRFLIAEPDTKVCMVSKCEIVRMLYDVAVSAQGTMMELLINSGGVAACMQLIAGHNHSSEALRVYSIRLLALILHCNRKQRDAFVRQNGFDQLATSIERHATSSAAHLRVSTFNCLFKFALDYFQPSTTDASPASPLAVAGSAPGSAKPPSVTRSQHHHDPRTLPVTFNGHMPSLLPQRHVMRRTYSMGSIGSECSDIEARLSIDETYQSQSKARDTVVYPQCVAVTISLLRPLIESALREHSDQMFTAEPSADGICSDKLDTSSTTSQRETAEHDVVLKVLGYLERIVDMPQNVAVLAPHPWMEWLWSALSRPLSDDQYRARNKHFVRKVEALVRSFVRKVAVNDLARQSRQSYIRRMKELVDAPQLQRIIMEEIVRHFSTNNRLDLMDSAEANNVIKNLDVLLQGLEDSISPFPVSLGLEVVQAIGFIASQNNSWVRAKMKGGKFFETRRQLSFFVLTTVSNFARETPQLINDLLEANVHEPNAALYVMRLIVDAVREKSIETAETLQNMLRSLYSMDEEQRRMLLRVLGEQELVDLFILQRRVVDGAEVEADNLITWSLQHDQRWDQAVQRIARTSKALEADVAARSERREKDRHARLKALKAEVERRAALALKIDADIEKTRTEVELRFAVPHHESMSEVAAQRRQRMRSLQEVQRTPHSPHSSSS